MADVWDRDAAEDFLAEAAQQEKPREELLGELGLLVNQLVQMRRDIAQAEDDLKAKKEAEREMSEKRIPDLMRQIGLKSVQTTDGAKVSYKEGLAGTLPKDPTRRAWALNFLKENGGEELIKHEVAAIFGKGEDAAAQGLVRLLEERGDRYTDEVNVHPQSLGAWAREKKAAGASLPLENLGLYEYCKTEIK